jgi:MFS family permease
MLEKRTFAAKPPPLVESWRELWRFLVSERHLFTRLAIACSMNTIMAYSVFSWAPTYARRVLGLSPSQVGAEMGLITTAGALAAAATFGYIVDRNFARGKTDYVMRAYAFGALIAVPFCLVGFTIDHHFAFLAAVMAMQGFVSAALGPATAAIQIATPPELRGRMAAAMLVVVNGLGFAVGPTLVGALTEFAFVDPQQVGNSIAVAVLICGPISAWAAWSGRAAFAARFKA